MLELEHYVQQLGLFSHSRSCSPFLTIDSKAINPNILTTFERSYTYRPIYYATIFHSEKTAILSSFKMAILLLLYESIVRELYIFLHFCDLTLIWLQCLGNFRPFTWSHDTWNAAFDGGYLILFHRLTRTAYLYNGCLPWYNVVLTSRVHSSVKYSQNQQSQLPSRATVDSVLNHCLSW